MRAKKVYVLSIILILGLLTISVGLNFYLFKFARQYYLQLNGLRLDPLGLDSFPAAAKVNGAPDKIRVVFFGDSRAAYWDTPDVEGFEFLNRGIGAQTSVQIRARYEEHIRSLGADILVMQLCINDLKTIPLFPGQKEEIVQNCQTNIQEITGLAEEEGAIVILTTVFPVGKVPLQREIFWSDDIPKAVVEVNTFIKSLGSEQLFIFDAYAILSDEQGDLQEAYRFDELHLNSAGYEALNVELVNLLKEIKER